ncbi:MAG: discoidin domain-containing protein, partial [Bacteroidales bacterium]|nr:discoidin domain-containing protein [Candidatus Cacconaster equifaecalis]
NENGGLIPGIDAEDMGSREYLAGLQAPYTLKYFPAETDVSIRHGWFYRNDDEQSVRNADNVFDMYERTVGGNTIFMLNIPPTREGVLGERDVKTLEEVGRRIRETYGVNLCKTALKKPAVVGEGLEMNLKGCQTINRIVLAEPIGQTGERIEKFAVDAFYNGRWQEVASGGNIGHKRIVRFASVPAERIRIRVLSSRAEAVLSVCSAHYYREQPVTFSISHGRDGMVSILAENNVFRTASSTLSSANVSNEIHYTTDGTDPDASSPVYCGPFKFENGVVKAVSIVGDVSGEIVSKKIGYDRSSWKMTINPYNTVIDCGRIIEMTAFNFIPNRNNYHGDYVSKGTVSVSPDGRRWSKVADFEFGNIINDPSVRHIGISAPVKGRYIRLDVLELVGDGDGFQSVDSDIEVL